MHASLALALLLALLLLTLIPGCADPIEPIVIEESAVVEIPVTNSPPDPIRREEAVDASAGIPAVIAVPGRRFPIAVDAQTDDLALALARVCVNEEGFRGQRGCAAIWQIAQNVRSRSCDPERHSECADGRETPLSALRRLSSRVTGQEHPSRRRQLWTSTLPVGSEASPFWRECPRGQRRGCDGAWEIYREDWVEMQAEAQRLSEARPRPVCEGTPLAWGCPDCGDAEFMARRNRRRVAAGLRPFVPLRCGEIGNIVYGLAPEAEGDGRRAVSGGRGSIGGGGEDPRFSS